MCSYAYLNIEIVSATLLAVHESLYIVRSTCADVERVGGSKSCVPNMFWLKMMGKRGY